MQQPQDVYPKANARVKEDKIVFTDDLAQHAVFVLCTQSLLIIRV